MKSLLKLQLNVTVVTTEISETQFQLLVNEFSMAIENQSTTYAQKQISDTIIASKNLFFLGAHTSPADQLLTNHVEGNIILVYNKFDTLHIQVVTTVVYTTRV